MRLPLVLVGMAALLPGCASTSQAESGAELPAELPAGVTVIVQQNRSDYAEGRMQIRVDNRSDRDVTVVRAVLADPRFTGTAEWSGSSDIGAGLVRDLPADLPDARCPSTDATGTGPGTETATETVELTFTVDGVRGTAAIAPDDPFDMIEKVTSAECAAEAVTDAVELTLADELGIIGEGPAEVAVVTVSAAPTHVTAVRLGYVQRTILLKPEDDSAAWSLERTASAGSPVTAELRMVPARCDPHAVAEDKAGTRFPLSVALDGENPAVVTLAASDDLRSQIFDYIARRCGWQ